jgi:hypothetical protein
MSIDRRRRALAFALVIVIASAIGAEIAAAAAPTGWDRVIISGASRFKVLPQFGGEAVLDKETGLVWQRSPSPTSQSDWGSSVAICIGTAIGGRRGWRLPTAWELMTLKDPNQANPALPLGHPFENVVTGVIYWSSTAAPDDAADALCTSFTNGAQGVITTLKTVLGLRWCVRGPGGDDPGTP